MNILIASGWKDYELIDSGNSLRFERFGPYKIVRPDPQAIWQPSLIQAVWDEADVTFHRISFEKGEWKFKRHLPEKWLMQWKNLSFWTRLTSFKHTGVFPEQSLHWEFIEQKIKHAKRQVNVLNLFGYTGIASLAAAFEGAKVTHVDASKPSIMWAKENQFVSKLSDKPIRWILDDAMAFAQRELRRGNTYDGIIMDPPVYGHGPTGHVWKFNENFPNLCQTVAKLLSPNPLFVIVNAYAISSSSLMLQNVLQDNLKHLEGTIESGELCLQETSSKRLLSTGIFARWSQK